MKKLNKRTPVVFHVGLVLLCLVLFSTYLTGGLYARYTTTASGGDSARVAKFHITSGGNWTGSSEAVDLELNFFDPAKLKDILSFTISSSSEVAVKYDVVITMPEGMEHYDWLEITLDKGQANEKTAVAEEHVFIISDVGSFTPNDNNTYTHTLTFSVRPDYWGNPGTLLDTDGAVQITIHAEQID